MIYFFSKNGNEIGINNYFKLYDDNIYFVGDVVRNIVTVVTTRLMSAIDILSKIH